MALKPKQQAQVDLAPPEKKAALRKTYERQNAMANRKTPKAKAKPRRTLGAQRGTQLVGRPNERRCLNFMDPLCPLPTPTAVASGKALAHTALVSDVVTINTTEQALLIVTQYGGTSTVGYFGKYSLSGLLVANSEKLYDLPTLETASAAGGPTSTRAMRLSCSLVNTTNLMSRGGSVHYLNSSQRLGEVVAPGNFASLLSNIRDSPYRKVINGDSLLGGPRTPNRLLAYPTDSPKYHEYNGHIGQSDKTEFLRRCLVRFTAGAGLLDELPRSMSIIVWVFDPPPENQTYRLTIRGSMYTRWPLASVPGHHMSTTPTIDGSVLNGVLQHVENNAGTLMAEGGLAAVLAPKLIAAAKGAQYLGQAGAGGAAGAAAEGVEMGEGILAEIAGGVAAAAL